MAIDTHDGFIYPSLGMDKSNNVETHWLDYNILHALVYYLPEHVKSAIFVLPIDKDSMIRLCRKTFIHGQGHIPEAFLLYAATKTHLSKELIYEVMLNGYPEMAEQYKYTQ
jgi:hypothetical protein